jgi:hypothetical protein
MSAVAVQGPSRELIPCASYAYGRVNWSRIIVDCPGRYCRGALKLPYGWPVYTCWDCDTVAPIVWPDNMADIAAVLALRPRPENRNWQPGETLEFLVAENIEHRDGIGPDPSAHPGRLEMSIINGRIVGGHPALTGPIEQARKAFAMRGIRILED